MLKTQNEIAFGDIQYFIMFGKFNEKKQKAAVSSAQCSSEQSGDLKSGCWMTLWFE